MPFPAVLARARHEGRAPHGRALTWAAALVATVVAANWVTSQFDLIPAAPFSWLGASLLVPAGTYLAGLALALRDSVQDAGGVRWSLAAIAAGCAVSWAVGDGRIALASAAAFALSELLDLAVYTPLRARSWAAAVIASGTVGAVADTVTFLSLSGLGLTWAAAAGQVLVKATVVPLLYIAAATAVRRTRRAAAA